MPILPDPPCAVIVVSVVIVIGRGIVPGYEIGRYDGVRWSIDVGQLYLRSGQRGVVYPMIWATFQFQCR